MALYIGIDLGATNAKAALVDDRGRVLRYASVALGADAVTQAPAVVAAACAEAAAGAAGDAWARVALVGLGAPGVIFGGDILGIANLFEGAAFPVPLAALVSAAVVSRSGARLGVVLLNDADAAVAAECWVGAAVGLRRAAVLTLGSGVGCGLVVDGRPLPPATAGGGLEGGHMVVGGVGGAPCGCGSRGCLEAYASANAVARAYANATGEAGVACGAVFSRAEGGDAAALAVVDGAAAHLALGCDNLCRVLDCERVVLAGGMSAAGDFLLSRVRARVRKTGWTVLPTFEDRVVLADAGSHAGCVGAAKAARDADGRRRRKMPPAAAALAAALALALAAAALARSRR